MPNNCLSLGLQSTDDRGIKDAGQIRIYELFFAELSMGEEASFPILI